VAKTRRRAPKLTKQKPSLLRRFFSCRPVRLFLLAVAVAALLFAFNSPVASALDTAWDSLLRAFGWGLILPAVVILLLLLMAWRRRVPGFLRSWNRWLGIIAFIVLIFGILAFFKPGEGILAEPTWGGNVGKAIIGDADALGGLRLAGIGLAAIFLVVPRRSWRILCTSARALVLPYRRYPLHRIPGRLASGLIGLFRRPPHRPVTQPIGGIAVPEYRVPRLEEPAESVAELEDYVPRVVVEPLEKEPAEPKVAPVPLRIETAEAVPVVAERASGASRWQLPPISLLERAPEVEMWKADVERRARLIEEALASYGVEAKVVQINVGPTVTQFGIDPGWDRKYKEVKEKDRDGNVSVRLREVSKTRVKVERIASLTNDLALALASPSIKIEAPVPGKSIVGIEVPNTTAALVSLRDVIESAPFQRLRPKTKLPMALGKGVSGESLVADLTKMPHLLVAGATGSGKSIFLKSMIITFLLHATPEEGRLLLVDPKRVELVDFRNVPHLVSPVIVDRDKAMATLKWLNREMDHRYDKLAALGARDIETYNRNPRVEEPLPYIMLIVDELAELMSAAPDEVERMICRLAQLARATGIHLVLATQRPSVDVVTGLIKANFPARISFAVASQVDSRTILDSAGAEKLLGRGDVLFLPADAPKPKRLQGSFISEPEIERVVSFWISQRGRPAYVPQLVEDLSKEPAPARAEDPLLAKARQLASEHGRLSTSFLQRRLGVGYPKAARLMDLLEEEGTVATGEPGKSREVLRGERERGG